MEGEALKAWRMDAGFDQSKAAAELGVSRSAYASYESGRRAVPPNVAAKITGGPTFAVENKPEAALRKLAAEPPPIAKAQIAAAAAKVAAGASGVRAAALAAGIPLNWAKALEKRGARKATAAEAKADPINFAGPNVWTWQDAAGVHVWKFSASGLGFPSIRTVGGPGGFVPNVFKDGGGSPKAPPGRKAAA